MSGLEFQPLFGDLNEAHDVAASAVLLVTDRRRHILAIDVSQVVHLWDVLVRNVLSRGVLLRPGPHSGESLLFCFEADLGFRLCQGQGFIARFRTVVVVFRQFAQVRLPAEVGVVQLHDLQIHHVRRHIIQWVLLELLATLPHLNLIVELDVVIELKEVLPSVLIFVWVPVFRVDGPIVLFLGS